MDILQQTKLLSITDEIHIVLYYKLTVRKHLCLIRPKQITELSRVWNISRLLNVCNMFHGCQIMERNACIIFYHYCSSYVRHLKETENSFQSPTLKQQLDPSQNPQILLMPDGSSFVVSSQKENILGYLILQASRRQIISKLCYLSST